MSMNIRIILTLDVGHRLLFRLERQENGVWTSNKQMTTTNLNEIKEYLKKLLVEPDILSKTSYILDDMIVLTYAKYQVRLENYSSIQTMAVLKDVLRKVNITPGKIRLKEKEEKLERSRVTQVKEHSIGLFKKGKYAKSRVKEVKNTTVSLLKSAALALVSAGIISAGVNQAMNAYQKGNYDIPVPTVFAMAVEEDVPVSASNTAVKISAVKTPTVQRTVQKTTPQRKEKTPVKIIQQKPKDVSYAYRVPKPSDFAEVPFDEIANIFEIPLERRESLLAEAEEFLDRYPSRTIAYYRLCKKEHLQNPAIDKTPLQVNISMAECFRLIRKYAHIYGIIDEKEIENLYRIHLLETGHETAPLFVQGHNFGGIVDPSTGDFVISRSPEIGVESFIRSYYNIKQSTFSHPGYSPTGDLLYDINYLYCDDAAPFYYDGVERMPLSRPEAGYWYELVEDINLPGKSKA